MQGAVLIGHSTGCQDAVRYVARHKDDERAAALLGVILQAPVLGREHMLPFAPVGSALSHASIATLDAELVPMSFLADRLQVSDREWYSTQPCCEKRTEKAQLLVDAGRPEDTAFR